MDDDPIAEPLETRNGDEPHEVSEPAGADGAPRPRAASAEAGSGRRRTVTGALMAGIAIGLREAFEPEYRDRTAIEQPAPEQPLEPQRYEIHLDPIVPESSFAIYRPWVDDDPDVGSDDPDPGRPAPEIRGSRKSGGAGALGG